MAKIPEGWLDYYIPETVTWTGGVPSEEHAVLKNRIGVSPENPYGTTQAELLDELEGVLAYNRLVELECTPLPGAYDLRHLQQMHRYLFQDVYPWAGQLRTGPWDSPMGKWGPDVAKIRETGRGAPPIPHFYFKARDIREAGSKVLDRIAAKNNLLGLDRDGFLNELSTVWARINYVHAFREGNTRVQFAFFRQLSADAGYALDTERFRDVDPEIQRANPLVGDLREQFVWGRFDYMQTGDLQLLREALSAAITESAPSSTPIGAVRTVARDRDFDRGAIRAAALGHARPVNPSRVESECSTPASEVRLPAHREMSPPSDRTTELDL